jgi:hypothetical protein
MDEDTWEEMNRSIRDSFSEKSHNNIQIKNQYLEQSQPCQEEDDITCGALSQLSLTQSVLEVVQGIVSLADQTPISSEMSESAMILHENVSASPKEQRKGLETQPAQEFQQKPPCNGRSAMENEVGFRFLFN